MLTSGVVRTLKCFFNLPHHHPETYTLSTPKAKGAAPLPTPRMCPLPLYLTSPSQTASELPRSVAAQMDLKPHITQLQWHRVWGPGSAGLQRHVLSNPPFYVKQAVYAWCLCL